MRSNTEPNSNEIMYTTHSFGSNEFRLNSQPFFPKSQTKPRPFDYYSEITENLNVDELGK
jgi:hypothetical protein